MTDDILVQLRKEIKRREGMVHQKFVELLSDAIDEIEWLRAELSIVDEEDWSMLREEEPESEEEDGWAEEWMHE